MTYALLIYRSAPPSERIPELEQHAALAGHRALQAEARGRDQLVAVARLAGTERARTVRRRGKDHDVTDGPYIETKEWLVGFYLVDCDTEAEALARGRVIADGQHTVEVRPVTWSWKP